MATDEILKSRVDSWEYEILTNAVSRVIGLPGLTCEIGIREGGSSYLIMDTLLKNNDKTPHVGIDPFGNIEYEHFENRLEKLDYTNSMKQKMLKEIYEWCAENQMEFLFFPLEDSEFFKRYADGIPIYRENKELINTYRLVFFDGPHSTRIIKKEIDFFKDRISIGGIMVFDDIRQYPHMENIDGYVHELGFQTLEEGATKISYIKNGCVNQNKEDNQNKKVFTDIFDRKAWGEFDIGDGRKTLCGNGSTLYESKSLIEAFPNIFKKYGISSMCDVACGDGQWIKNVLKDLKEYHGMDVVDKHIEGAKELYSDTPYASFSVGDLCVDDLPKVDIIFSKDTLVHLDEDSVIKALKNFIRSGSTYLMTTQFLKQESNKDIRTGDWRELNFEKAPFNFPPPLEVILESTGYCKRRDKALCLWKLDDLRNIIQALLSV